MQWTLGALTGVILFGIGLPSIYYFAIVEDGGIESLWRMMWPPYVLLNALLMLRIYFADWEQIGTFVRMREGLA
jgi:hypothetical protein